MNKWYVSRQCYWPDGDNVVEIAYGGLDYANADMLADQEGKYRGHEGEYTDPREALEAAFAIRELWEDEECRIETGATGGYTMPFSSFPDDDELRKWAEKAWENVPKCDRCGEAIQGDPWVHYEYDDWKFCSEVCAEMYYFSTEEVSEYE